VSATNENPEKPPRLPPRWVIRGFWRMHRALYRFTGGRIGVSRPKPGSWGTLRLTTTGRRTGEERSVMLGYFVDDTRFVTLAMNGWGAAEPAWWLNLQANPNAVLVSSDWSGEVVASAATDDERERLWARWQEIDKGLDGFAALRPGPTAVVVLEPRSA